MNNQSNHRPRYAYSSGDKDCIAKVVQDVLYRDEDTQLEDVKRTLNFTVTSVTFDEGFNPIIMNPGFSYPGMLLARYVIIQAPELDETSWRQCTDEFRRRGMVDFAFKFHHIPTQASVIELPQLVWYQDEMWSFGGSYRLIKDIIQRRLGEVQSELNRMIPQDRRRFCTYAEEGLERALAEIEEDESDISLEL